MTGAGGSGRPGQEIADHAQADVLAFFRVELCGKKIVTLDGTREGQSIVRGCDYLGVDCWACEV